MAENTSLSKVAKLLITKVCHDLAGPIGAVSNGVEFLSESAGDKDMTEKSISLLQLSSLEGSVKLQVARQAFGIINQAGDKSPLSQLKELLGTFLTHNKINIIWLADSINDINHTTRQILINLILIATASLIRGGKIEVSINQADRKTSLKIKAEGPQLKFDDSHKSIINNKLGIDEITPHTAQIYFTVLLIGEIGATLSPAYGEERLELTVSNIE